MRLQSAVLASVATAILVAADASPLAPAGAFAVTDGSGRVRGLRRTLGFPSASVVKAMLLVAALRAARAARMRRFALPALFDARIDAADQARFFRGIDRRVPARHRRYARRLLSSIVGWQRWGVPSAARARRGTNAFFKGGWRGDLVHQAALLQRGDERLGLAILTSRQPSHAYGRQTVEGVARRVLRVG